MIEALSEDVHDLWVSWAKSLIATEKLSIKRIRRWEKCFVPYKKLSKRMKEKDRKIARQFLKTIRGKNDSNNQFKRFLQNRSSETISKGY